MKFRLYVILISVLMIILVGCKKDYPKDIPEWLENMITERKKDCKKNKDNCSCYNGGRGCMVIEEWKYNSDVYYTVTTGDDDLGNYIFLIYDYDGNHLGNCEGCWNKPSCAYPYYPADSSACDSTPFIYEGSKNRDIWQEAYEN